MHDTSVVEHDIETTPRIYLLDGCGNIGLLADIADSSLDLASSVGDNLLDLGKCLLESRCRNIAHQNRGTFAGKQNAGLKTNTAVGLSVQALCLPNVLMVVDDSHGGKVCSFLIGSNAAEDRERNQGALTQQHQ